MLNALFTTISLTVTSQKLQTYLNNGFVTTFRTAFLALRTFCSKFCLLVLLIKAKYIQTAKFVKLFETLLTKIIITSTFLV